MKRGDPNFEENHVPTRPHAEPQQNREGRPLTPIREPTVFDNDRWSPWPARSPTRQMSQTHLPLV